MLSFLGSYGESPEPTYDAKGNRSNTREQRAIAKIKKEQSDLVREKREKREREERERERDLGRGDFFQVAKAVTLTSKLKGVDLLPFRQKLVWVLCLLRVKLVRVLCWFAC